MNTDAAIFFEPDGYLIDKPKLMGRQSAGNGFLRAAVQACQGRTLHAYATSAKAAQVFTQQVNAQDTTVQTRWIPKYRTDLLKQVGALYLPGPGVGDEARLRLHEGCDAYSIIGVTHTIASHKAMESISGMICAPVMPWDALICTSAAVLSSVKVLLEQEADYLRWRLNAPISPALPQLPVIPLGVHCQDFEFSAAQRLQTRQNLKIADDEIVLLFVGRLSFHAKAHPHIMYQALQTAAEKTGKKITLLQSGWFSNPAIEKSFIDGAKQFCPDVKAVFVDGREEPARLNWAAADIFISLADNIQETFGLTPIEAMAAGLPVIVSDWDGYKDTVRNGIDGFRIPTWMPPAPLGEHFALRYETGTDNYDTYCGITCRTISVDLACLTERLCDLILQPELRAQMGAAGRRRAREVYDWAVIYRQYQALYQQLNGIRQTESQRLRQEKQRQTAPRVSPARLDPYQLFANYPTALMTADKRVSLITGANMANYSRLVQHGLFNYAANFLPSGNTVEKILQILSLEDSMPIRDLAVKVSLPEANSILVLSFLVKIGFIRLTES
jgi:alpha-maltose-1-phosphate synthase